MKSFLKNISFLCIGVFIAATAMASDLKIGVVDINSVMESSGQADIVKTKLEKEFKPRQEKLMKLQDEIKADTTKLGRDTAVMSAKERGTLQTKIVKARADLQHLGQEYQQDLGTEQNKEMQAFFNKVKEAVDKVAKEGNYDLILQRNGIPFVVDALDVTGLVVKNLG